MKRSELKAAIIAGGKGTRIRSLTGDLKPKALVPVAGKPISFWMLDLLNRNGIQRAAVMSGHLEGQLKQTLQPESRRLGMELTFFREKQLLGTAGCLHAARDYFRDSDFLVLYGDIAVEMDLVRVVRFHREKKALATIVAHPNDHPHESDLLQVRPDGRLLRILPREDPRETWYANLVPAAVYCLSPDIFEHLAPDSKIDFINDLFPALLEAGQSIFTYNTPEYLKDMGTPNRYHAVEADMKKGLPWAMSWFTRRPAIFFDRDGVLNPDPEPGGVTEHKMLELYPHAARAVKTVNRAGWLAVVATNQPHLAKGFMTEDELALVHAKLETLLGYDGARLDRIFYCPHHLDRGYPDEVSELKVECTCRKPGPGMILKAAAELPVDLAASCFIGDTARDMGAARSAKISAYGVRTGKGCRDCTGRNRPDLMFQDAAEAAAFAVTGWPEVQILAGELKLATGEKEGILIIGVCGLSRSGKSTLAHTLCRELEQLGLPALHVRMDDWIVPENRRGENMESERRSQVNLLPEILDGFRYGQEVCAPGYDPQSRGEAPAVTYDPRGKKVIVLDGLYACHSLIVEKLDMGVMVVVEESLLLERFFDYYRWKGTPENEIEPLLDLRRKEEWPAVESQRELVDRIIRYRPPGDLI